MLDMYIFVFIFMRKVSSLIWWFFFELGVFWMIFRLYILGIFIEGIEMLVL